MAYYNELRKYGTKAALIDENGNEMTYEQLDDECVRLGSKLDSRKLVFAFCSNTIGSICGYVAFLYIHVVPVLVDEHIEKEVRRYIISIYNPDY